MRFSNPTSESEWSNKEGKEEYFMKVVRIIHLKYSISINIYSACSRHNTYYERITRPVLAIAQKLYWCIHERIHVNTRVLIIIKLQSIFNQLKINNDTNFNSYNGIHIYNVLSKIVFGHRTYTKMKSKCEN